jgi:hypothetical protein
MRTIPKVNIEKRYFVYLFFIVFLSTLLHEWGHAITAIILGGKIVSYQLVRVIADPVTGNNPLFLLGGPLVTLLICYFATYQFFKDRNNADLWLATIFANFSPLVILLYIFSWMQDELVAAYILKIPPVLFFFIYLIIFSFPLLVLIKAPKMSRRKKILFYLYSMVILVAELNLFVIINEAIFR